METRLKSLMVQEGETPGSRIGEMRVEDWDSDDSAVSEGEVRFLKRHCVVENCV